MAKSKTIRVTRNVQKSLEELKTAVKSLPAGDLKKRAEGAISYLSNTFKGKPQPGKGRTCPVGLFIRE
jgi:hypothetical protein